MRTAFDMSPFFRSSMDFEKMFDLWSKPEPMQGWGTEPVYDIVRLDQDTYRIDLAVPGMTEKDVSITYQPNMLLVSVNRIGQDDQDYLYHGIQRGGFSRRFQLADYVEVANASLVNGVLSITLKRELPEAIKPRRIEIQAGDGAVQKGQQQIEQSRQAA